MGQTIWRNPADALIHLSKLLMVVISWQGYSISGISGDKTQANWGGVVQTTGS